MSPRRILHLSDVHFGPPHLPEAARGVFDLVEERRPDLVVVSGDLTQRARPEQFRQAREWVDSLPVPVLAVPGNHDVPMYRWAFLERFFSPYGAYRRHFSADLEPVFEDQELLVVGINTAFNWTIRDGRVSRAQLARAVARLGKAPAGRFKIAVAHHNLIDPPEFGSYRPLGNSAEVLRALAAAGASLVLSGHAHVSFQASSHQFFSDDAPPVLILHSGTSTSSRFRSHGPTVNGAWWIEVGREAFAVSELSWQAGRWVFGPGESHPRR